MYNKSSFTNWTYLYLYNNDVKLYRVGTLFLYVKNIVSKSPFSSSQQYYSSSIIQRWLDEPYLWCQKSCNTFLQIILYIYYFKGFIYSFLILKRHQHASREALRLHACFTSTMDGYCMPALIYFTNFEKVLTSMYICIQMLYLVITDTRSYDVF